MNKDPLHQALGITDGRESEIEALVEKLLESHDKQSERIALLAKYLPEPKEFGYACFLLGAAYTRSNCPLHNAQGLTGMPAGMKGFGIKIPKGVDPISFIRSILNNEENPANFGNGFPTPGEA